LFKSHDFLAQSWDKKILRLVKKNHKIVQISCLVGTYIYYFILFYIRRAILTQTNPKKGLIEKKHVKYQTYVEKSGIKKNLLIFKILDFNKFCAFIEIFNGWDCGYNLHIKS